MIRAMTRGHCYILLTLVITGLAGLAGPVRAQSARSDSETLLHTSTHFELTVHASLADTAPLFGPEASVPGRASTGTRSSFIRSRRTMKRERYSR
jgi:hypothetical protein